MKIRTLFSSLAGHPDGQDSVEAVSEHLNWLFSSWQGSCYHEETFGIPHFETFGSLPHADHRFAQELREVIRRYEPRIVGLDLRIVPHAERENKAPFFACYEMRARLDRHAGNDAYSNEIIVTMHGGVVPIGEESSQA